MSLSKVSYQLLIYISYCHTTMSGSCIHFLLWALLVISVLSFGVGVHRKLPSECSHPALCFNKHRERVCASAQHHTYSHAQLSVGTTEFVHILHWRLEAWTTVHGIWWPLVNTVQVWWWSSDNSANLVAFGGQVRWSPDNISVQCCQWWCVGLWGWDSGVTQNRQ